MPKITVNLERREIDNLLEQLSPEELEAALKKIQSRLETFQMMKAAETAFTEWAEEEDLYGVNG